MRDDMSSHESRQRISWGVGIALGMGVGVAVGVSLDNLALGVAIGLAIGVVFAIAVGRAGSRGSRRDSDAGPHSHGNESTPGGDGAAGTGDAPEHGPAGDGGGD